MQPPKLVKVKYTLSKDLYSDFLDAIIHSYHNDYLEDGFYINKGDEDDEIEITIFTDSSLVTKGLRRWSYLKDSWVLTKVFYTKVENVILFIKGDCKFYSEPYYELTNCAVCNNPIETIITSENLVESEVCWECSEAI